MLAAASLSLPLSAIAIALLSGGVYNWMYAPEGMGEVFDAETGTVRKWKWKWKWKSKSNSGCAKRKRQESYE